ncbi:MAG: hypothetical protein CBB95_17650 [Alteromonas sp. TMED35]|jgi:uncharacterized membrane protein YdbT with pleckstrin-like domain|uniref:PH domain-containing protein n=1 Tax=uncultured Alteromonas sp. TaxID=179113 RepID=UPI000B6DB144|nr:MAG: hypothetical protein CBB95_17650 [Alteromonas sp. TMED35]|tara:strand:+ start:30787 stop:31281 length:495 start_codon:yes stop_codon:yes gene_type:complete
MSVKSENLVVNPSLCGISVFLGMLMKVTFIAVLLWLIASSSSLLVWLFTGQIHWTLMLIFVASLIGGMLNYFRSLSLRIEVKENAVCISKGVLISKKSHFRIKDIYHVDTKESVFNRLTRTFCLAIHTHGDSSDDLVLDFVKNDFKNTDVYSSIMAMRKTDENS